MKNHIMAAAAAVCVFAATAFAEESPWSHFDLESTDAGGITVHYEKCLAPDIGEVVTAVAEEASSGGQLKDVAARLMSSDAIFQEMDRLIGPLDNDSIEQQRKLAFAQLAGTSFLSFIGARDVYILRARTVKDFMHAGGALPKLTYDRDSDKCTFTALTSEGAISDVPVLIQAGQTPMEALTAMFVAGGIPYRMGVAFHEVAELSIYTRLQPRDSYLRWFHDGFANAIAEYLLREHLGADAAEKFMSAFPAKKFAGMKPDLNLRFWQMASFEIMTPGKAERDMKGARYAYATVEADHLITEHGIGCVKTILDSVPAGGVDRDGLVAAIRDATGEDVTARLDAYQRFKTADEGYRTYADAYAGAVERKDYEAALGCLMRMDEVSGVYDADRYDREARMLMAMGNEDIGARAFLSRLDLLRQPNQTAVRHEVNVLFVDYALDCKDPSPAYPAADELLAANADYVPAMTVRMVRLARAGKQDEAGAVARRIISLDPDRQSPYRKRAEALIHEAKTAVSVESTAKAR